MSTICLDFGNTRQKIALFENDLITQLIVLNKEDLTAHVNKILDEFNPKTSILSSVINHPEEIELLLQKKTTYHKLTNSSKLPITIPVGKPETVGADRLALACAAVSQFPRTNILVIGSGSCITYNFINKENEFLGGSISPGMEMRFRSMHEFTALLPLVQADWNIPLIGYDTKTNLQTGVLMGISKEIDGMIDEYKQKFSNFNVLLTGGDIAFFEPHLKNKIFADPDLLFKGLYAISQINDA